MKRRLELFAPRPQAVGTENTVSAQILQKEQAALFRVQSVALWQSYQTWAAR